MATGSEHYRAAESLLICARDDLDLDGDQNLAGLTLAEAQVHATLALAAAIGVSMPVTMGGEDCMPHQDSVAWAKAASAGYHQPPEHV